MQTSPQLILLNGAAGAGKTTIAQKYLDAHPLALSVNDIIVMMGQWLKYEPTARELVFELTKSMASTHLSAGHDVILPYLLIDASHADAFEEIARRYDARFFEIVLLSDKEEAVERLLQRGTWGEVGTSPITESDRPVIEDLYDKMVAALDKRPNMVKIHPVQGEIEATYRQFHEAIS